MGCYHCLSWNRALLPSSEANTHEQTLVVTQVWLICNSIVQIYWDPFLMTVSLLSKHLTSRCCVSLPMPVSFSWPLRIFNRVAQNPTLSSSLRKKRGSSKSLQCDLAGFGGQILLGHPVE